MYSLNIYIYIHSWFYHAELWQCRMVYNLHIIREWVLVLYLVFICQALLMGLLEVFWALTLYFFARLSLGHDIVVFCQAQSMIWY